MEVLKGEQFFWNDKEIFLEHNALHCLLPVLLHLAAQLFFFLFLFYSILRISSIMGKYCMIYKCSSYISNKHLKCAYTISILRHLSLLGKCIVRW